MQTFTSIRDIIDQNSSETLKEHELSQFDFVLEKAGLDEYFADLEKAIVDNPLHKTELLEKGRKDLSKLVQKTVTDKRGHQRKVWVKVAKDAPKPKQKRSEESADDNKSSSSSQAESDRPSDSSANYTKEEQAYIDDSVARANKRAKESSDDEDSWRAQMRNNPIVERHFGKVRNKVKSMSLSEMKEMYVEAYTKEAKDTIDGRRELAKQSNERTEAREQYKKTGQKPEKKDHNIIPKDMKRIENAAKRHVRDNLAGDDMGKLVRYAKQFEHFPVTIDPDTASREQVEAGLVEHFKEEITQDYLKDREKKHAKVKRDQDYASSRS